MKISIPKHIFRAYDIRGIVDTELNETTVLAIGKAIGTRLIRNSKEKSPSIFIAKDARLSGPRLLKALQTGLLETGCNVVDLGVVPTPVLSFATCYTDINSGVVLTGSHNPANYNGLKITLQGETLSESAIQEIYQTTLNQDFADGMGNYQTQDLQETYIEYIAKRIKISKRLKVVVDAGNGVAGIIAPKLLRKLGCEVIELYCELDGNFPNHHPDPSNPKNLQDLINKVKALNADIGLAFDGDADRLGVITNAGNMIFPDRQLMLYAKHVLKTQVGAKIIYDVKCSLNLAKVISANSGIPIISKTGHSLIKKRMFDEKAALAGEMSGHIFFNDRWFGFDDAIYTAARLLEILDNTNQTSDELFNELPNSCSTPEINITIDETIKFSFIKTLQTHAATYFKDAKIVDIDGVRVEFPYGFALVRASNTTANLVLRFEADTKTALDALKKSMVDFMRKYNSELELDF
ncbi:MAG: phosphomannomutase/phosphoglucomutase [Thiotrichales bacterium]|nr:MAG: phosphomannomutase/phosphoglucomutase [Thiotrichales bacterium]